MVFEKALSRKAFGSETTVNLGETSGESQDDSLADSETQPKSRLVRFAHALRLRRVKNQLSAQSSPEKKQPQASMGKILNLIR